MESVQLYISSGQCVYLSPHTSKVKIGRLGVHRQMATGMGFAMGKDQGCGILVMNQIVCQHNPNMSQIESRSEIHMYAEDVHICWAFVFFRYSKQLSNRGDPRLTARNWHPSQTLPLGLHSPSLRPSPIGLPM